MNYLILATCYRAFEYSSFYQYYLDLFTYAIYNDDEKNQLQENVECNFLKLPQTKPFEVQNRFLLTNKKSVDKRLRDDESKFYTILEDHHWVREYHDFEKQYLMEFGAKWCKENGVRHTMKNIK